MTAPHDPTTGASPPAHQPEDAPRPSRRAYISVAAVLTIVMLGGTLPVPLYLLYEEEFGFGSGTVTIIFAVYAFGTLAALLFLGRVSDARGRKPILLAGLALTAVSTVVFLFAAGTPALLAARLISGVGVGLVTGTAAAALAELHPRADHQAAALISSVLNLFGLGLGTLLAGLLAEYAPFPTRLVYALYLAVLLAAVVAVMRVPETASSRGGPLGLRPQLSVPTEGRRAFFSAAIAVFAAFSLLGLFSSLVPQFLSETLGQTSRSLAGAVTFLLFAAGAAAQLALRRLDPVTAMLAGLPTLVLGLAILQAGLALASLGVFLAGAVVGGVGVGLAFRGSFATVTALASEEKHAAVMSTFFLAVYTGLSVPVLAVGAAMQYTSVLTATTASAAAVGVLAAIAAVGVLGQRRTSPVPTTEMRQS